jgi:hypothetical protein
MRLERAIALHRPSGEVLPVTVWLNDPTQSADGSWHCACGIDGLRTIPGSTGDDAMQAVILGFKMLRAALQVEEDAGSTLFLGDSEFPVRDFFCLNY